MSVFRTIDGDDITCQTYDDPVTFEMKNVITSGSEYIILLLVILNNYIKLTSSIPFFV